MRTCWGKMRENKGKLKEKGAQATENSTRKKKKTRKTGTQAKK